MASDNLRLLNYSYIFQNLCRCKEDPGDQVSMEISNFTLVINSQVY